MPGDWVHISGDIRAVQAAFGGACYFQDTSCAVWVPLASGEPEGVPLTYSHSSEIVAQQVIEGAVTIHSRSPAAAHQAALALQEHGVRWRSGGWRKLAEDFCRQYYYGVQA